MAAAAAAAKRRKPTITGKYDKVRANVAVRFLAAFSLTMLGVSIEHLAHGLADYTGTAVWSAWSLALATDGGLIAAELSLIMFGSILKEVRQYAWGIIAIVLPLSMFMNWHGFAAGGKSEAMAIVLGIAVPLLLWLTAKLAGTLWIAANRNTTTVARKR